MKKKMEQIRNGKFEYELPRLILSKEEIHVRLKAGEKIQDELFFGTENEEKVRGYVNTTNRRFVPSVERFSGTAIQFAYGIDAEGMKPGQVCQGVLNLITNVGEYEIPYTIQAEKEQMQTSAGEIQDLQAFVRLARKNYREAFRLFTNPEFAWLLEKQDARQLALYQGMSTNPVTYQHLEEFLIGAGLKEPVSVSLKEEQREFYEVTESIQESLTIQREGWGHLRVEVEAEGDFIQLQKRVISEEEFIGSVYALEYVIRKEKLGKGKEYGSILVKTPYKTLVYQITASQNPVLPVHMSTFEKSRKAILFQDFMKLQLKQMDFKTWTEHGLSLLQEMREAGCDYPIYQIYEAYIYNRNEQSAKANEILLKYQDRTFTRKDLELAGAYLYVCYKQQMLTDRWDLSDKLQQFYHQQEESFLLLWILLQVDEEYKGSPLRAANALEHQYEIGCRSPLMYLEAYRLLKKEMNLLTRTNKFWTQVLLFAAKNQLLTEEIAMRTAYLSSYEKEFSGSLFLTLTGAYEAFPTNDTLEAICKMIMKDTPGRKKYFPWFERAVEQNLHLTRLYECYIESMDERYQKILPKSIRRYFVYNNALSDQKKAFVYANVVRHKEEDLEVYGSYQKIIHDFAYRKIQEGAMNEDYAVIYQELAQDNSDERELQELRKIMFTHRLYCDDQKIRNVIVRHAQLKTEKTYPCQKGVAYPEIYTEDAVILFQDTQQRRYVDTVDYNLRSLFGEELVEQCGQEDGLEPGYLLHVCSEKTGNGDISPKTLAIFQQLIECDAFTPEYQREIRKRLLHYYEENARDEEIDDYLHSLNYGEFASVDKKQLLELLIERGMLKEAYEVLCEYGYEQVSTPALVKLTSRMILQREFAEDEELVCLAGDVFDQNLYDEVILHYLMLYYVGPVETLLKLWESAKGFQLDTYALEEKILGQLVFVEDYLQEGSRVLESYVKQKGQESVIASYLTFLSYGYFIHGQELSSYAQLCLEAAYDRDWKLSMVCKSALLKLHSQKKDWTARQERQVRRLLEDCGERQLSFAFFQSLPCELLAPYQLDDKVFVEYQGDPSAKVTCVYALDTGLGQDLEYQSEPLRNEYQGYFNKTFTLFYGESLHYYFKVETKDGEEVTGEKILAAIIPEEPVQTRYQMINQMLSARKLGRNDVVKTKIQQYQLQEKFVGRLFSIEKGRAYE